MRSFEPRASLWADLLFAAGAIAALLVLAGWSLDVSTLRDFNGARYPDWPITAAANLMLSIALLSIGRIAEPARRILLLAPIAVALIALAEYITGVSLGLDQLLFPTRLKHIASPHAGRPGLIPCLSLLVMGVAGWLVTAVRPRGGTILFLAGCAMIGLSAMSLSLLLLLGESGLSQQSMRIAASLPVTLMLLSQAGGLLVWLVQQLDGLPWSRGRGMRPVNLALIVVLVLPAILLPIQLKFAALGWVAWLPAATVASALNVLLVVGLLGWAIDRISREQARLEQRQAALDASRAQLESILETVPDGMVVIDEIGRIERFSAAAERIFGYRAEQVVGRELTMLMPALQAEQHADYLARYRTTGQRRIIGQIQTLRARRADGTVFPIELSVGEARVGGKRIFTGFIRDISDRVAAETHLEQLNAEYAHSARLNAMGEMAAALAHELNQPLAAVGNFLGAAEAMLEQTDKNLPVAEMIDKANAQLIRAGEIVRRLRDFMVRREVEMHSEDLTQIIADAAAIAFVGQPPAQTRYDIAPAAKMILADRVQTQQVLVNILRNAAEAMRELPSDRRTVTLTATATDGMAEICVGDTGPGFTRKVLANLHAPFLSTKGKGGMGVGLSISRRIVEAHGGRFTVRNTASGGAMLCFTLPLSAKLEDGQE